MRKLLVAVLGFSLALAAQADVHQRLYNTATTVNFKLYNTDGTLDVDEADGGTEVAISCNEGAETTATNDFADEGNFYSIALTATELQCARATVVVSATTTEVFFIETYGNASAQIISIPATSIASGGITAASFAAGAVDAAAIAADAIGASELATDAIGAAEIAADAIAASEVAANAIGAAEVADGAIDAGTFAASAIDAAAIAADAIGSSELATDAIGAAELATDAIGAAEVAANALTTAEIATGAISSDEVADGAIDALAFAAGAIDATAIAADAIGASEVATDAIGAAEIAANALTTAEIATGAISADEVADDAIDVGAIANNAIAAAEIADGALDEATFATTAGSFEPLGIIDQGTAVGVTGTTIDLRAAAAFADDELIGAKILITGGSAGVGQTRTITDYALTNDRATVATWTTTPTGTVTYMVVSDPPGSGGSVTIAAGGIAASSFAAGAIDAAAIATDAIGAAEIAASAIGESELATDAITAAEVAAAAITEDVFAGTAGSFDALGIIDQGTAQSATATTLVLRSAAAFADDELNGSEILLTGGTGEGQTRLITDYVSTTDTATVATWTTTPSGTITYQVRTDTATGGSVSIGVGGIAANSFAAGAIDATAIAADAIGSSEVAADAIGASELATDAIGAAELAADAIGAAEVATDAIDAGAVAADTLGASELAANAIGASEIADGALDEGVYAATAGSFDGLGVIDQGTAQSVTATTLQLRSAAAFADDEIIGATCLITGGTTGVGQSRTVTDYVSTTDTATVVTWTTTPTGTILYQCYGTPAGSSSVIVASGGITASSFAADAITASAIAADAVGASELATDAIGAAEVATDALGAAEIAADALGASEIATDAIGAAELAASAIGSSEIADGGITSAEFGTGAITATVMATDAIGAAEIADGGITSAEFGTGAITATVIAADAIGASEIAADAITATEFADGTIDAAAIAGDAITAAKIAADAITASELAADAIGASEIGADAIGASELAADALGASEVAAAAFTEDAFATTAGSYYPLGVVDQGTAQAATGTTLRLRAAATFADDEVIGAKILITGGSAGVGQVREISDYVSATDTATVATWTTTPTGAITYQVVGEVATGSGGGLDAAGVRAAVGLASANLDTQLTNIESGVAITDGSIGTATFASGAINAAAIATGALGADEIAADAIGASELAADAIGASELAADAIAASELAAGGVTEIQTGLSTLDAAGVRTAVGLGSANLDTQLAAIDDYVDAEVASTLAATVLGSGTIDSGTTLTAVDAARTEATSDYWKGAALLITSGSTAGQARCVTGFNASSDTLTVRPAFTAALSTNTYLLVRDTNCVGVTP